MDRGLVMLLGMSLAYLASLAGMALFWAAIGAKAPPLLAPGSMVQLGLLGLAYTYKHPALKRSQRKGE